jgi:hypothetical protein
MNMVPPTDGREHDPLQRWKGAPVMTWGVGGTMVTSFPKSVPRYAANQSTPAIIRTPGEVKVQSIKNIDPLEERLAKFPGPLRGKSKKKEAVAWLTAGIDALEKEMPEVTFHSELSLEAKRVIERMLLWKILKVFIDFDGTLEGSPSVVKAVRDILSPGTVTPTSDDDALFPGSSALGTLSGPATAMQSDGADPTAVEQIRTELLRGDRERAVWAAVDKRLWGHAMLISHTVSPELYRHVAQEFVRKEVNFPGHSNESIAALYKVMSGSQEECVDELVPSHARAGLQLMSTNVSADATKLTRDGLDKWRETLSLVLSNRSADDNKGLHALGMLLASYGRAEAAQICFMFSRSVSIFGGLDDPNANFVLLGSDHRQQTDQFAKELEALQLSEMYEYGLTLSGGASAAAGAPHLAAYKLQHAMTLAENGYRDKALQYCEAIATLMTSQTRRSPYHHAILEASVQDLMIRLKQAPKGEGSSWISKPSMNKVSDSMWNRFNKFVAGDEQQNGGPNGDAGSPFAHIGSSPNMSPSPSVSNFETYQMTSPSYGASTGVPMPVPTSAAASRYGPMGSQPGSAAHSYTAPSPYAPAPASSMPATARSSNEYSHGSYEPAYPGAGAASAQAPMYTPSPPQSSYQPEPPSQKPVGLQESPNIYPSSYGAPEDSKESLNAGYQPASPGYEPPSQSYEPSSQGYDPPSQTYGPPSSAYEPPSQYYEPPSHGYEPPQITNANQGEDMAQQDNTAGGYEPPSYQPYGYEPPSYEPATEAAEEEDDEPKTKKKGVMYDDDDDMLALKSEGKSKADKDKENEEMFRKAAEEDGKH